MSNLAIAIITITSIIQSTQSLITSTNCGDLIISCQGDIDKCCRGGCCPFLKIFQKQNSSSTREPTDESEPKYTPKPIPSLCPKIGEQCSSQYERTSRCCGDNSKCRFENYDSNGLIGTCCILHNTFGCQKDSDCCKYDGICVDNYCKRNLNPNPNTMSFLTPLNANTNTNTNANTNSDPATLNGVSAGRARGRITKQSVNLDTENVDLHERNRSKPNYDIWVSLTANTIILYFVLLTICIVFCCWYKKNNNKMYERRVVMGVRHVRIQKRNKKYNDMNGINNMECDIDESDSDSDSTEPESDHDELPMNYDIYSSSREV
eukprot:464997_1